ncbi:hypothetical protein CSKR_105088 [Clonorchis sinensis]|uniref:Uncharacterized protein n=1 Tax=Clonorchis sinensis TaxID=79923 RepID=A0A3R7G649_CLOSI|nr:hypothetical protein CSKR_105088 [Clonorchis sinensis]
MAPGPDGLHHALFKGGGEVLVNSLTTILQDPLIHLSAPVRNLGNMEEMRTPTGTANPYFGMQFVTVRQWWKGGRQWFTDVTVDVCLPVLGFEAKHSGDRSMPESLECTHTRRSL